MKNYENKFFKTCFFHGDVGVGKTHLAFTLVNYFKELYKDKKIIYVDSFKLNFEYNNHLRDSCFDVKSFIQKFADCDFLIIDDLHKFQGLNNINSMLFSLVEFLLNRNKKIIFFSSEPLRDINDFDPALKSRILSGIQCEIKEADTNVIKTLIKRFFETQSPNLKLTAGAIEYLAFLLGKDIRRVYGHLATLSFYLNAGEQLIMVDAKIIEELLEKIGILDTIPKNNRDDVYNQIVLICEKLKADVTDVLGRSRKQEIVNNRNVIAYILKTEMKMSLKKIGKVLDRDHTTIKNSLNQMENEFKRNKHFKDYVESLFSSKLSTK
ncbi:DnaA ATPase domain-containing protein [Mycoplasmoides fastidiosum]|uniref:DnaA/Hda family protein n=1 Tax=Mycoplasmoides fastidiosum TaxID=92758 RepID=UPI0021155B26|nr:DnaA/Hda family protein [Mycoplasmoides fastidiosum]UUD38153.1 DnaA/Hda family protein [Mycoplasmoides fastidiosum]